MTKSFFFGIREKRLGTGRANGWNPALSCLSMLVFTSHKFVFYERIWTYSAYCRIICVKVFFLSWKKRKWETRRQNLEIQMEYWKENKQKRLKKLSHKEKRSNDIWVCFTLAEKWLNNINNFTSFLSSG